MMNEGERLLERELFELERDQVNWLMSLGTSKEDAFIIVAYSNETSESLSVSYYQLKIKGEKPCSE